MRFSFFNSEKALFAAILIEILFLVILVFLSAYLLGMQSIGQKDLKHATQLRYESFLLADQLRQSSDDLTRMVRTYAVTGESRFEKYFWDILAIREGKKARPTNYERIYWDFMTVKEQAPPSKIGEAVSLEKLMEEVGFTEREFQLLTESKNKSDSLVSLERKAMQAMKGMLLDENGLFTIAGEPDPEFARSILFGERYHEAKREIMKPINEFFEAIDKRTSQNVNRSESKMRFYQLSLVCIFGTLVLNGLLLFLTTQRYQRLLVGKLKKAIGKQILEIAERKRIEDELRENEAQMRTLIETLPDLVWLKDPDGVFLACNKKFERFYGAKEVEIVGKTDFDFIDKELADSFREKDKRAITAGKSCMNEEEIIYADDGHRELIETIKTPMYESSGKLVGVLGVGHDITNRKKMEDELLKVRKLESVGVLAGGIAHDFNNILSGIMGNIELVSFRIENDHRAVFLLNETLKAVRRGEKLTQQLLTFSKGGEPVKEKMSLTRLLQESAEFVLHGSQVLCEYSFPDDLWVISADSGQISQVVQNIILNAKHAMPEGGKIIIRCCNEKDLTAEFPLNTKEGDFVRITIQDNGIGISRDILTKVFDPYFTTKQDGSGLGLAICHSIIHKHGGDIKVQSNPGKGTVFTIYLPADPLADLTDVKEQKPRPTIKAARIIVMDDEEMVRNMIREQLSILGHEAVLAVDGKQAIKKYQELQKNNKEIDLIITDLTIPGGMGGREAAEKLLQINPDLKIIVASGYSNDPVVANFRDYGFCAAITKPFNLEELRRGIESALG